MQWQIVIFKRVVMRDKMELQKKKVNIDSLTDSSINILTQLDYI